MKRKNMPTKESLALVIEAANRFNRYLYDLESVKITQEAAAHNAKLLFDMCDPSFMATKKTRAQLLSDIRGALAAIADYRSGDDPQLNGLFERYSAERDKLFADLEEKREAFTRGMGDTLRGNNLGLELVTWTNDTLKLSSMGERYMEIELYQYQDNPVHLHIRDTMCIDLSNEEDCKSVSTFMDSASRIVSNPTLRSEIIGLWRDIMLKEHSISADMDALQKAYRDEEAAIVYGNLKTFSKETLGFEIPEKIE